MFLKENTLSCKTENSSQNTLLHTTNCYAVPNAICCTVAIQGVQQDIFRESYIGDDLCPNSTNSTHQTTITTFMTHLQG